MGKLQNILFKAYFNTLGKLSYGVQLTMKEGLTSGKVLNYIYKNKPEGNWFLLRWIDAHYLKMKGWEAVRIRRRHLESLFFKALQSLNSEKAMVMDIASGYADYIFNMFQKIDRTEMQALCLDIEARWVEAGNALAESQGIQNKISFTRCNCLDRESFLNISYKPNIVISSGFYDWLSDDDLVLQSITLVSEKIDPEGYFILTHQMNNPNADMVADTFNNCFGKPCQMKMYSAETIDDWLERAGFKVLDVQTDVWNFFRVILAGKEK